ncbi:hypothetical protein CFP65_3638 [Kitasatospora sp. MMS16-BH015]|uniref:trypsin-like serine peptidase n=1 Tax=Kitasatospora sp. MMS16-BH015 TaxID=2018025 RepID=UPI000CA0FE86|nr:hypothetical protein [Kitasatospora sp. MMS16-BH015]AUG78427.1 hypothetical protein CFP65_3638 [Kitasatospora sp. MMS16-BH015]
MNHVVLFQRAAVAGITALALAGVLAAPALAAPRPEPVPFSAYTGVERIPETTDPAAAQAAADHWTPEAMRAAVQADGPAASVQAAAPTGLGPSAIPPVWRTQPKPATSGRPAAGAPAGPTTTRSAGPAPVAATTHLQAQVATTPTTGLPTVGALFFDVGPVHERCTGTVINTGSRNVIATAGHCLWNRLTSWLPATVMPTPVFVPGYHDGQSPYGKWTVKTRYYASAWRNNLNPDYDFGFIVLNDLNGKRVQDVVGGNAWRTDAGSSNSVEITGYPDNRDQPLQCFTSTQKYGSYASQLVFPCDNFHTGVSGSLLMQGFNSPAAGLGTAIASLGGYQEGGNTDNTSYAVLWNGSTATLINSAVNGQ